MNLHSVLQPPLSEALAYGTYGQRNFADEDHVERTFPAGAL